MRTIALAALALGLSACGGGNDKAADDANLAVDNMLMDDNLMIDSNASLNGATGLDANASVNAGTETLKAKDSVTNDPDTNLANGL